MDNRVRFAVIGTAGIGGSHIKGISLVDRAVLTAVCDIDPIAAKKCADANGLDKYYTDYKKMLCDGGFDCVIIATPDQCHLEQATASVNAGYHVLCEKPLAMTMDECRAIVDAVRWTDRQFMVGQVCRKTPGFMLAKKLVEDGEIGELFFVESEYAHDYSILQRGEWRKDPVRLRYPVVGGGCHAMDLLRWIAGDPVEVTAYSNHKVLTDWPVDDCTIAILKYPNNVIGKVLTSIGCKRPYTMRTVLYGTKGTIITDNTSSEISLYKPTFDEKTGKHSFSDTKLPVDIKNHNVAGEIDEMVDAILGIKPLETDAIEGANTIAVCLAAVRSSEEGRAVVPEYIER
jgi:predicted dehydrogenase